MGGCVEPRVLVRLCISSGPQGFSGCWFQIWMNFLNHPPPCVRPQGGVIQKIHPDLESAPQKTLGAGRYAQTDQYPRLYTPPHHELWDWQSPLFPRSAHRHTAYKRLTSTYLLMLTVRLRWCMRLVEYWLCTELGALRLKSWNSTSTPGSVTGSVFFSRLSTTATKFRDRVGMSTSKLDKLIKRLPL